jgi:hypothetical protein
MSDADQIAMIKNFYLNDLPTYPDLQNLKSFRQSQIHSGNLISKNATITSDGKSIENIQVWKSADIQLDYRSNPILDNYITVARKLFSINAVEMPSDTVSLDASNSKKS